MSNLQFMKVHKGNLIASNNSVRLLAYKTANDNSAFRVYNGTVKVLDTLSWSEAQNKYFTLTGNRSLSISY